MPKYDVMALPIRNHSPFTYEDLKLHARGELDANLCCYTWKMVVCLLFSFLLLPFILLFQTGCMFFAPLKRIISQLNEATFWTKRGVMIFLTQPGQCCGCFRKTHHCVVVQYGLNGQRMHQPRQHRGTVQFDQNG